MSPSPDSHLVVSCIVSMMLLLSMMTVVTIVVILLRLGCYSIFERLVKVVIIELLLESFDATMF